jgi:hypothetical protein
MRLAILALAGCFNYLPEPQGPRVVCDGTVVGGSYYAVGSSSCYQLPADPCWNDDSEDCQEEADARREANAKTKRQETTVLIILGTIVAAGLLLAVASD